MMATEPNNPATNPGEISKALEDLHLFASNPEQATQAVSFLAGASKQNPAAREQLADPKALKALITIVDSSLNNSLETADVALRCVGNACIDNNAGREAITDLGVSWALQCLRKANDGKEGVETAMLAAKVLYNTCADYEPAQQLCYRECVHYELLRLCEPKVLRDYRDLVLALELLFWICSQKQAVETSAAQPNPMPEDTLRSLLALPQAYVDILEAEDFALLLETCLIFLRDTEIQRSIVEKRMFDRVWRMLQCNEKEIALSEETEDQKLLVPLSASLTWCLSDMAASAGFVDNYHLEMEWIRECIIRSVQSASGSENDDKIENAACQILGNLLWAIKEPEKFGYLVETEALHLPAIKMLAESPNIELLHSASGLLIQLSRPSSQIRETIAGDEGAQAAIERLCRHENQQLKQDAIKLLRALGKESSVNQARFAELAKETMLTVANEETAKAEAPN